MGKELVVRYTGKLHTAVGEAPTTPDNHVRTLADSFYREVCSSGRFSWMGLFKTKDQYRRPRLVVYLAEPPIQLPESSGLSPQVDLVPAFTELSLALRPTILLDLYYIESEGAGISDLAIQDVKHRYPASANPKFLWEVDLREH